MSERPIPIHHAKRTRVGKPVRVARCGSWSEFMTDVGANVTCPECKRLLREMLDE